GGASFGYSPAAMRSVQSANIARCSPNERKEPPMFAPTGPDFVRRSHASRLLLKGPKSFVAAGILRVALSPSLLQIMQSFSFPATSTGASLPLGIFTRLNQ